MKLDQLVLDGCLRAVAYAVAGSGCLAPAVAVAELRFEKHGFEFDEHEIVTGSTRHQAVLTGFLLGGPVADLAVVSIDESGGRLLRTYTYGDGTWASSLAATLRPEVSFVDVGKIGGTDRLITYEPGRLSWFDPESASERELVTVHSSFSPPRKTGILHVDVTRDLNGDGRDDLVVPDVDGFRVFIQLEDGSFAAPVMLGPPTDMSRIYGADGYRYDPWSQSRVHELDYNHDGRSDLMFWSEDHFEIHTQDEHGLFDPDPKAVTTEVAFDSDQLSSLTTGDMTGRVLHSLTDMDGDGVADLVVFVLEGESSSSKQSRYEVHFGARAPSGDTVFDRGVDIAFQSAGRIQLGMDRHDFDGDGQLDLMFTTIDVKLLTSSFWKRWAAFWGQSIWLNYEFYRMDGGRYRNTPSATRRLALAIGPIKPGWVPLDLALRGGKHESRKTQMHTIALEGGWESMEDWRRLSKISSKRYPPAFDLALLIGDVTGDGRSDLLLGVHTYVMEVFVGVPGKGLFARKSRKVAVTLPHDEEYTWLVDLNNDGKQDVVMHDPFTRRDVEGKPLQPPRADPHRVTILMAR